MAEVRKNARAGGSMGDPAATAAAVLRVVDADEPPLRLFLGSIALGMVTPIYEERLATWRAWQPVAVAAHGNPPGCTAQRFGVARVTRRAGRASRWRARDCAGLPTRSPPLRSAGPMISRSNTAVVAGVQHRREEALQRDVAVTDHRAVRRVERSDLVVGDLDQRQLVDVVVHELGQPTFVPAARQLEHDADSGGTRASANESRRVKTKLMSVRKGLVGVDRERDAELSCARVAAGAMRSLNASAASSRVRERMLPVVSQTESAPAAAAKSSDLANHTRSSVPMLDTAQAGVGERGRVPADGLELRGDGADVGDAQLAEEPELVREPASRRPHSSLTEIRGCAEHRAQRAGQRGPVIWSSTSTQAKPSANVGTPGRTSPPGRTMSRTTAPPSCCIPHRSGESDPACSTSGTPCGDHRSRGPACRHYRSRCTSALCISSAPVVPITTHVCGWSSRSPVRRTCSRS